MKDSSIYLKNILDKAKEAVLYCEGISKEDFLRDDKTQSAVVLKLIDIDLTQIWNTVQTDLPDLINKIESYQR